MAPHCVLMAPGSMRTTRMPKSASSTRSASERASRAYLVAWYHAPMRETTRRPPIEETLMIVPERRSRMPGATAFTRAAAPNTFTSNCRRASASATSSTAP